MSVWNLWHGCKKISAGCQNCYVYRTDERFGKDSSLIHKTGSFDLPLRKNRAGDYKIPFGETVYTCFTSDFFLKEADEWRGKAWDIIKKRSDLNFLIITKRINRFADCTPSDWGDGYDNVIICSTCENQEMADYRLPILKAAKIKHKMIILEPLLGPVDISPYLGADIRGVIAGGESGEMARICDYSWVLSIREQCEKADVPFQFKQTGAKFLKDGRVYRILRKFQHSQARKANIDYKYKFR